MTANLEHASWQRAGAHSAMKIEALNALAAGSQLPRYEPTFSSESSTTFDPAIGQSSTVPYTQRNILSTTLFDNTAQGATHPKFSDTMKLPFVGDFAWPFQLSSTDGLLHGHAPEPRDWGMEDSQPHFG